MLSLEKAVLNVRAIFQNCSEGSQEESDNAYRLLLDNLLSSKTLDQFAFIIYKDLITAVGSSKSEKALDAAIKQAIVGALTAGIMIGQEMNRVEQ